ncbi:MAG: ribbon-helix-helix domain-containing protein [Methanocorpusculum sp.]|nr:ribbon-helix-helix domain-containing protein [Methanocorpusculum sp.]
MGRIRGKPIKTRITYYAPPETIKIINKLIEEGKFNNKSDVVTAAITEYSHIQDMECVEDLEERYCNLEERIRLMEEQYSLLISAFTSLQKVAGDKIIPKQ